jgi:hypothetical protein
VSADRAEVLVAGYDLALVGGLADLLGAELLRRGESDAGTEGDEGDAAGDGRGDADPTTAG